MRSLKKVGSLGSSKRFFNVFLSALLKVFHVRQLEVLEGVPCDLRLRLLRELNTDSIPLS